MKTLKKYVSIGLFNSRNNIYTAAWLSRITTLGYTSPNQTTINALNAFFNTISTATISKIDILYIFLLNDSSLQNAASINFISPTLYKGSYVNSPTYGVSGIMGDGSSSYFDTNFNPAINGINFQQNLASRIVVIENAPTIGNAIDGNTSGTNNLVALFSLSNRINSSTLSGAVDNTGVGYRALNKSSSTTVEAYRNATPTSVTVTTAAVTSANQYIGRSSTTYSNVQVGLYAMGGNLSQAEHNAIRSAYLTYKTAIGL